MCDQALRGVKPLKPRLNAELEPYHPNVLSAGNVRQMRSASDLQRLSKLGTTLYQRPLMKTSRHQNLSHSTIMSSCTAVSPTCPVSATTYGYYPNLPANVIFCVIFGLCTILQLLFGLRLRTYTWLIGLVVGGLMETLGYLFRLLLRNNPWSQGPFAGQIICLILAPSFLSAAIDLTLKHVVIIFGPQHSPIRPTLYTWFFILLDVFSILLQAAGGGAAGSAGQSNRSLLDTGNNLLLAGIVVQVVQLILFGSVTTWYLARLWSGIRGDLSRLPVSAQDLLARKGFRGFAISIAVAYFAILTRCIYR